MTTIATYVHSIDELLNHVVLNINIKDCQVNESESEDESIQTPAF